jgi:hypothetical protein
MRVTKLLWIAMCFLLAAPAVWSQATTTTSRPGILGYLDPQTGAFRPVPQAAAEDIEAPAAATIGRTITVTLTNLKTTTLKTTTLTHITCSAAVSALDGTTSPVFFEESNTVVATGTGTTRTCKLTIPYSWSLASAASDSLTTGYTVLGSAGTILTTQRTASRSPLDVRKVPANGAITALTASVTL